MDMKMLREVSKWLVLVGALNWGLVGVLGYNLVEGLLGLMLAKWVYILVGLAGLWGVLVKAGVMKAK